MPSITKILFPVDLTEAAPKISPYVRLMAEKFGAEVHVLFVAHVTQYYANIDMSYAYVADFETEVVARSKEKLQALVGQEFKGMPVKAQVVTGYPGEEILRYVINEKIDLIVMGHCRTGLQRVIFGSVADRVVKYSPVPVLVVNPDLVE
jgi:nucleotide-binding universal stress UspA family protein